MSATVKIASTANHAVKAAITALENEKNEIIQQITTTYDRRIAGLRGSNSGASQPVVAAASHSVSSTPSGRRRRHGTLRERVGQLLAKRQGKVVRVKDIVSALGDVNPSHVSQVLNKMAEEGDAERVRHGQYQAVA